MHYYYTYILYFCQSIFYIICWRIYQHFTSYFKYSSWTYAIKCIVSYRNSHIGYNIHARYWLELDSCIAPALQKCVEFRCKNYEEIHHWNDTIFRQQRCHLRHMDYIVKQLVDIIIFLLTLAMVTFHSPNKPDTTIYSLVC